MMCECPVVNWEKVHTGKCQRDHLTYKEILERQKPTNPSLMAPVSVRPKDSKGNNAGYRFKQETIKNHIYLGNVGKFKNKPKDEKTLDKFKLTKRGVLKEL